MKKHPSHRLEHESEPTLDSAQPSASISEYEPPAIIYRGVLETRAGTPTGDPFAIFEPEQPW